MIKDNHKDNHIKIRVSEKEKELAYINAKKLNMKVSQYIRYCISIDYPSLIYRLPDNIATKNLLNKIYHQLEGHTDSEILTEIRNDINDYYNTRKERTENA